MNSRYMAGWIHASTPSAVTVTNSSTGATFQETSESRLGRLHCFTCKAATRLLKGTGASVSVSTSTGAYWPADTPYLFYPVAGEESLGWVADDGNATDATVFLIDHIKGV